MIKKSLRAYITRRQLEFFILPHSEMIGVLFAKLLEQNIDRVFKFFVVLPDLHRVYHLDQRGEILFLGRRFVVDIADEGAVKKRFCLEPEIIAAFSFALRVRDERRRQLQNVFLAVNIREGIVVHGLFEVDGVEHLDFVTVPFQQLAGFQQHRTFRKRSVKI